MRYLALLPALLFILPLSAQVVRSAPDSYSNSQQATGVVPATNTLIVPAGVQRLIMVRVVNTSASPVTLMMVDGSTDCNGAACPIEPTVSIPANGVFTDNLLGAQYLGGVYWQAGTAGALVGVVKWRN